jgi:very-short-patch-repair endonuclease/GNAT superfamily N-acetyltransferase
LVAHRDQAPIMLDEHFRCRPELIAFSNRQFYGEALRVMRDSEDDRGLGPAMLIHELRGVPPLGKTKVNRYEAEALVDELCRLLADPAYRGLSFGVLSLFKEQIEHIEQLVDRRIPAEERRRRRLICSTVDGFQGDERDVILYSWRYTPNTWSPAIFSFTNGRSGDQRINVALTRARHQAIHFISAPVDEFPQGGNVGLFLQHAHAPEHLLQRVESRVHREPLTVARRRASDALRRAGLRVTEQFVASGVGIDLVVHHPDTGARVAVFVDGEIDPEPPPTADRRVDAHGLLERAGWIVVRILATEALSDPAGVERRVRSGLERCGPRNLPNPDGQRMFVINVRERERAAGDAAPISAPVPSADMTITREDRADYHWPAAPLEKRLLKVDVFQSDFERDLHDRLARNCDLKVVPQWPSRGKFIDLVITDRAGRRLAIEADGEQHHLTVDGELIPEDVHRQKLLEEVGWVFHRVRHSDFRRDPDGQVEAILRHLAEQPVNERLAAETWAESADLDELDDIVAHDVTSPPAGQLLSDKVGSLAAPFSESGSAVSGSQEVLIGPGGVQQQQLALSGDVDEYLSADEGSLEREPTDRESTSALPAVVEPTREEIDPYGYRGAHLDDVPLAIWPMQIALAVQERGPLVASEIPAAYAEVFGVEVPRSRHRLLTSFAWSAGGRNFIRWDDEDRWIPGDTEPQAMNHLAPWTMNQITQVVRALLDQGVDIDDLFKRTISIVWPSGHRVPRPIARAVGSCVYAVAGRR